jgi:hypothetical protein
VVLVLVVTRVKLGLFVYQVVAQVVLEKTPPPPPLLVSFSPLSAPYVGLSQDNKKNELTLMSVPITKLKTSAIIN